MKLRRTAFDTYIYVFVSVSTFGSFCSSRFLPCLCNIKHWKLIPLLRLTGQNQGWSFWALPQAQVWATWGKGWGPTFCHCLRLCSPLKLLRQIHVSGSREPVPLAWTPKLSTFPSYSPKTMLSLLLKAFFIVLSPRENGSCLSSSAHVTVLWTLARGWWQKYTGLINVNI